MWYLVLYKYNCQWMFGLVGSLDNWVHDVLLLYVGGGWNYLLP